MCVYMCVSCLDKITSVSKSDKKRKRKRNKKSKSKSKAERERVRERDVTEKGVKEGREGEEQ